MISIIVAILVLGVLWWGAQRIFSVIPIAEPFKTVAYVLIVCVVAIWLIYAVADVVGGFHLPRLR